MPASTSAVTGSTSRDVPNGFRALLSVLRRWVNIVRTIRVKSASSTNVTGGGRNASRTTADETCGGGRKAPGGRARMRVTSACSPARIDSTPYSLVPGLAVSRSATSRCSMSVASASPPVVAASFSSMNMIGDEML